MFGEALSILCCPYCSSRSYVMDPASTFNAFSDPNVFKLENVEKLVDGCIAEYTVFTCLDCGASDKLTVRGIEKAVRKEITKRVLTVIASAEVFNSVPESQFAYIYCNKCPGFDGKGSCPLSMYENCDVKRFPSGL